MLYFNFHSFRLQLFCLNLVAIIVSVPVGNFTGGRSHKGNSYLGGKLSKWLLSWGYFQRKTFLKGTSPMISFPWMIIIYGVVFLGTVFKGADFLKPCYTLRYQSHILKYRGEVCWVSVLNPPALPLHEFDDPFSTGEFRGFSLLDRSNDSDNYNLLEDHLSVVKTDIYLKSCGGCAVSKVWKLFSP